MPSIPAGFQPIVAGYSFDGPSGGMRTEVAGGAARYGLEWARGTQMFNVTLLLTRLQLSVWMSFFHGVLQNGSLAFDMPLDSGFGLSTHSVNIVPGSYGVSDINGATASVAFVVEAETQAYQLSTAEANSIIDLYNLYGDYSTAMLDRLAQFANFETAGLSF